MKNPESSKDCAPNWNRTCILYFSFNLKGNQHVTPVVKTGKVETWLKLFIYIQNFNYLQTSFTIRFDNGCNVLTLF